ncbi:MAG TPA: trigger factor [Epsilonproteobacteria bacterium]|nr:trigger factor [Campylobacterota bacterium]HHD78807.1 trigger factor [Campylobacterota bacterium]
MKVTVKKVDDANIIVSGTLDAAAIDANVEKLAKQAAKEIKVDGFRAGKVPVSVVKQMHGEKLAQDAEGEALRELIDAGLAEAKISAADMLGQPGFKKYEKTDKGIEVEVEISTRPTFDAKGYMDVVPAFEKPKATKKEVDAKLKEMAAEQAPFEKIARKRAVKDGDMTLIDFEGFVDGVAFDGGKAENFNLKIGSGQFIPGFEEQIIGMKYDEQKDVVVTFPKEYQAADLAGKEATFKVTLHEIQEQKAAEVDDALAQKLLNDEKATLKELTEKVEAQVETTALSKIYNEEIKPKLVEALVKKFDFALPNNIVEQEIDAKINAKAQEMSEDELAQYKDNEKKINELRDSVREDAVASVKATFIVDALAKEENITVEDQEVSQAIYYEAMMSGQDPQQVIKYYQDNNLLPAVKMGMIEDKLFGKMLGLDN